MQIHSYPNAAAFLDDAQSFLEENETLNSLILGIAQRLKDRGEPEPNAFFTVREGSTTLCASLMNPPHRVLISSTANGEDLALLARAFHEEAWDVPGVNGPAATARVFSEKWQALTGQSYQLAMNMRLYDLVQVVPPPPVSGIMRLATESDVDLLTEWFVAFDSEASHDGMTPEIARNSIWARLPLKELYVWEDHEVVAMTARSRPTRRTMTVNAVYTPPAYRRRGYATALVAQVTQSILDMGYRHALLFTDLANPTSNSIYQKIGYRPVTDFDTYVFDA